MTPKAAATFFLMAMSAVLAAPLAAQIVPAPHYDTPRIQTAQWRQGEPVALTALPETALTVMLEPGEIIRRAALSGNLSWNVAVSAEADSFQVTPMRGAIPASLRVETDRRTYDFLLEAGEGLMAAYLVRLQFAAPGYYAPPTPAFQTPPLQPSQTWSYRLRGKRAVFPQSVSDDGNKTFIEYSETQQLPAVFAIGPTGQEEVVDGYMRDGRFVIDRVHDELVFRIDKAKATARRNPEPEARQ